VRGRIAAEMRRGEDVIHGGRLDPRARGEVARALVTLCYLDPPGRRFAAGTRPAAAPLGLGSLFDLAALQAARADVRPAGRAVHEDLDALEVRVEAALRRHHRVAPVVTERRLLPADGADL